MRAGSRALSLLAVPLNARVLQALEEEPRSLIDLRRAVGSPPQTTMRTHLRCLSELGVVVRERRSGFPGPVDYELGGPGAELLGVARTVDAWLALGPEDPAALGSAAGRSAVKALVDGWSSTLVRALAARPLSLTELNRLITTLNYPSLERRLGSMRRTGLLEPFPTNGRSTPYAVTSWLRRGVAPLAAAARWERAHLEAEAAPVARIDVEAGFLLSIPLLRLPPDLTGVCRLVVELPGGGDERLAGVMVEVREGQIFSCVSRLAGKATGWASGSIAVWLAALIEQQTNRLELGGDARLAAALVDGMHQALFGVTQEG